MGKDSYICQWLPKRQCTVYRIVDAVARDIPTPELQIYTRSKPYTPVLRVVVPPPLNRRRRSSLSLFPVSSPRASVQVPPSSTHGSQLQGK
ncbi:hypothetical protein ACS0TY_023273 [Phlomoides rotata]